MTPSTVDGQQAFTAKGLQDKEAKISSARSFTTKSQIMKVIMVMSSYGVTGTMAAMAMIKNCQWKNLMRIYNTATLGLRKNSMVMTIKSTSLMELTERISINMAKQSGQVTAMTSLTLAMTGMELWLMEVEETTLSTFQ